MYKSKYGKAPGTSHAQVIKLARAEFHKIQKRNPRRQAFVRSKYFKGSKIFINQFWRHIAAKHPGDQTRRLKLYSCGLDMIRNSTEAPRTIFSHDDKNILLHRFVGQTKDGERYIVQIKENKRTGRKDFMSVFPAKDK